MDSGNLLGAKMALWLPLQLCDDREAKISAIQTVISSAGKYLAVAIAKSVACSREYSGA